MKHAFVLVEPCNFEIPRIRIVGSDTLSRLWPFTIQESRERVCRMKKRTLCPDSPRVWNTCKRLFSINAFSDRSELRDSRISQSSAHSRYCAREAVWIVALIRPHITIYWQRRLIVGSRKKLFCAFWSYFPFPNSTNASGSLFKVQAFVISCLALNILNNIPVMEFEIRIIVSSLCLLTTKSEWG